MTHKGSAWSPGPWCLRLGASAAGTVPGAQQVRAHISQIKGGRGPLGIKEGEERGPDEERGPGPVLLEGYLNTREEPRHLGQFLFTCVRI